MNKKMDKKAKYLITWSVSLTVTVVLGLIGQALFPNSEDQQSPLYYIFVIPAAAVLVDGVVFLVKWIKTCPVCR